MADKSDLRYQAGQAAGHAQVRRKSYAIVLFT